MKYILRGHDFHHDVYTIIQLFYPNEKYTLCENVPPDGIVVESGLDGHRCYAVVYGSGGVLLARDEVCVSGFDEKRIKNSIKATVLRCFTELTGYSSPWGILTGIRPTKKAFEYMRDGLTADKTVEIFEKEYFVSPKKARLCIETAETEADILSKTSASDVSVYIGIPFCPTRCLYCSFTSNPIEKYAGKMDDYIWTLEKEISYISNKIKERGERLQCVYIGGGTPTSLDSELMERLMDGIAGCLDMDGLDEFCCEAGRPDTITPEKLAILKEYGVTRLSVNPQTMNDKTLKKIGRRHSVQDFLRAYEDAGNAGFDNINVDVIFGLPDETETDARNTLEEILKLDPSSLTAHTLCVKRAAELRENIYEYNLPEAAVVDAALDMSYDMCKSAGLNPYYMYRQKYSIGNFENVGYCKDGCECIYNVQIMEENQTIYAAGAGSVTKVVYRGENRNRIERAFNVKNVDEYIARVDEMLERKEALL